MRLRHIEIFHAVYTTGSITNAAKILHVSQPSVSKVLSHAEMQLGFQLFDRVKGRLLPTDEARMLFDEVDKIYQQMRSINNTAQNLKRSDHGTINIALTPALGFDCVPEAIAQYHQQHPSVNFNIQTVHNDAVMQALFEHQCDFAVLFSPPTLAGITSIEIGQSELVIVYPKSYFEQQPQQLTLSQLSEFDFIDINDSGPLGGLLWNRIMEEDIEIHSRIKVQTYFIGTRLVAKGAGICVVDKFTAMGNLSDDIAIASFDPPVYFNINVLHLENNNLSNIINAFIPHLSSAISEGIT